MCVAWRVDIGCCRVCTARLRRRVHVVVYFYGLSYLLCTAGAARNSEERSWPVAGLATAPGAGPVGDGRLAGGRWRQMGDVDEQRALRCNCYGTCAVLPPAPPPSAPQRSRLRRHRFSGLCSWYSGEQGSRSRMSAGETDRVQVQTWRSRVRTAQKSHMRPRAPHTACLWDPGTTRHMSWTRCGIYSAQACVQPVSRKS